MSKKYRSVHVGATQIPLIIPDSTWTPPAELPDLRRVRRVALDTENRDDGLATNRGPGWTRRAGHVCGISVAWRDDRGDSPGQISSLYAPIRHPDSPCLDRDAVRQWLSDLFASDAEIVFHNAHYDVGWLLADLRLSPPKKLLDTTCMAFLTDENLPSYKLDRLCKSHGIPGKNEGLLREALAAYGFPHEGERVKGNLWRLPARFVGPYAEDDAVGTLLLSESLDPEIAAQDLKTPLDTEMRLVPMVVDMMRRGVRVDLDEVARSQVMLRDRRDAALRKMADGLRSDGNKELLRGGSVGLDEVRSATWLERAYDAYRLHYDRTSGGATQRRKQGKFEAKVMRKMAHWLPRLAAAARDAETAASKFMGQFILEHAHMGRLHASVHQYMSSDEEDGDRRSGARSHRFAYSQPPLQQMYSKEEGDLDLVAIVRGAFLPEEGEVWGAIDECHDEETEILTEQGWVKFPLLKDEKVAQWHRDSGLVDFIKPTSKFVGQTRLRRMYRVKSKRVDVKVTGNHRVILEHVVTKEHMEVPAAALTAALLKDWRIPQQTSEADGSDFPISDDLIRLAVVCQADGADRRKWGGNTWVFYLKKERKLIRLIHILQSLDVDVRVKKLPDGRTSFRVFGFNALNEFFVNEDKTFNLNLLMKLSNRQKKLFIEELGIWDGTTSTKIGHRIEYGSSNERNVEIASIIGTLSGYVVRKEQVTWNKPDRKPFFMAHIVKEWQVHRVQGGTDVKLSIETNQVYCVTVPSGYIVTRRHGKVAIGGNSQQEFRLIVHFATQLGLPGAAAAAERYRSDPSTDFHDYVVEITRLERDRAKATNFAKAFGAGRGKFADMVNLPQDEADSTYDQYDQELPFVSKLAEVCQRTADRRSYVVMVDGARAHFPHWEASWIGKDEWARGVRERWPMAPCTREEAERRAGGDCPRPVSAASEAGHPWVGARLRRANVRNAMNLKVQGSGARKIKRAMLGIFDAGHGGRCLLQMHDDLNFSLPRGDEGRRIAAECAQIIVDSVPLLIPTRVDQEFGVTWGRARKAKKNKVVVYGATWEEAEAEMASSNAIRISSGDAS